jgi:hypothetical protein
MRPVLPGSGLIGGIMIAEMRVGKTNGCSVDLHAACPQGAWEIPATPSQRTSRSGAIAPVTCADRKISWFGELQLNRHLV